VATRLKTVKYAFPALASLANNTLTNLTQITIDLEAGTKTFRTVVATITCDDIITATGGSITTKTFSLRVGAAGYTTVANANTLTNSGENISLRWTADYTSHFTTNWSGSSMTCDFQATINHSTGTTTGMVNVCVTLDITYEYDDTQTTHVKTVMIPLNMPVSTLATSATTYDTMPALDTYLPEASKSYKNLHIVVQGMTVQNAAATDMTMTLRAGAASVTTGNYEGALQSDRFFRYVWNVTSAWPSTASTQTWQPTSSLATRFNHLQAWLVVTYSFNASTTTSAMNSVMLPMELSSPMGGTTSADYQRGTRELFIQEPNITGQRIAFYPFWNQIGAIAGLNMRIGTGSFVTYTDGAAITCGSNAAMVRNDSAFTLARGRNELNFDAYRTDTTDYGWNLSGFWLVNYTSDIAANGIGAHNHTVERPVAVFGTAAAAATVTTIAQSVAIPETEYFITALGTELTVMTATGTAPSAWTVLVERLAGEGGIQWEPAYIDSAQTDPEVGAFLMYSQMRALFYRWDGDPASDRIDLETGRRWRIHMNGSTAVTGWYGLSVLLTYHSIQYTVAGTVSDYVDADGAGLTVWIHRTTSGERIGVTTTTSGGAFSWPWHDDTEEVFAVCLESSTTTGASASDVAV
jgi:hypothetical protein